MKTIIVIDDAEYILESTILLLNFEGYNAISANNGFDGLEKIELHKPDLILCDISMPKLDGYGVLEKVRSNPLIANTPFIFLTAFTEKSNMRTGMERGADDFLFKPFTRDELIAAIDAQWNKHSRIESKVQQKVVEVSKNVTMALPHEFRTVLNEVLNSAKLLYQQSDNLSPAEVKDTSFDIINSATRLNKITENFLVYVSIELINHDANKKANLKDHFTAEPSAVLSDVADMIADRHYRIFDLNCSELVHNIAVEISPESLYKVFNELLDNAFRFSAKGKKVIVKSRLENNFFRVTISDSGRGMSREMLKNVSALSQFQRDIYEQQGVGLGLIISKKIIELYNGTFEINSREGFGTDIAFSLPIKKR